MLGWKFSHRAGSQIFRNKYRNHVFLGVVDGRFDGNEEKIKNSDITANDDRNTYNVGMVE